MPTLGRFVRVRYRTDGEAKSAMRLLNSHLEHHGMQEGEAEQRVLAFIGKRNANPSDGADRDPRGPVHVPRVLGA